MESAAQLITESPDKTLFRVTRDVTNPDADRRYKRDWSRRPTIPAGTLLELRVWSATFYHLPADAVEEMKAEDPGFTPDSPWVFELRLPGDSSPGRPVTFNRKGEPMVDLAGALRQNLELVPEEDTQLGDILRNQEILTKFGNRTEYLLALLLDAGTVTQEDIVAGADQLEALSETQFTDLLDRHHLS